MAHRNAEQIRTFVRQGAYSLKAHAHQRMTERNILTDDIESVIVLGEVVEENLTNFPYPTSTFMRYVRGQPLYAVCAFAHHRVFIVTVHWMDPDKWTDPWTRRKS